jgi:hypothetical protein
VVLSAKTNFICHMDLMDFRGVNSRGRVRNEVGEGNAEDDSGRT